MSRTTKTNNDPVELIRLGNNRYKADLFRNFVGRTTEDSIQYECEYYRTEDEMTFASDEQAMEFYTANFDLLVDHCILAEAVNQREKDMREAHLFLKSIDHVWFKAFEHVVTEYKGKIDAQEQVTMEGFINDIHSYISERFPFYFRDRQRARDIINGVL